MESAKSIDISALTKVQLADMVWCTVSTCGHISKNKCILGFSYHLTGRYVSCPGVEEVSVLH